ncbi:MAG: rhodanese-like domain-containing protein [Lyngbya sp.]|nr:rhodanese-like domain-containing protein [Lyngbya sp.]
MLINAIKLSIFNFSFRFLGFAGLGLIGLGAIYAYLRFGTPSLESSPRSQFAGLRIAPEGLQQQWIVSGEQAKFLIEQGATLLDARSFPILHLERLENAAFVRWQDFSPESQRDRGKLLADDRILTEKLQAIGIFQNKPVIVYIDPKTGWGEDGRIVWMLRSLGHSQAVWVDGGFGALVRAGLRVKSHLKPIQSPTGDFQVERCSNWQSDRELLKSRLNDKNLVILDSREPREYAGKTPYGERRGGHLPGAIHLYYKEFLDENGMLFSRELIREKLAEKSITPDKEIVSYCTGGVRSAWLTTVLVDLGFSAKNYPGSTWEWSAYPAEEYPLL